MENDSTEYINGTRSMPKSKLELYSFILNVYIDGFLCVLGYFGNTMTIIVLQHDKVKTSNSIFLQALAIFDNMFLTYVTFYVVLRSVYPYTGQLECYYTHAGKYMVAYVLPFGWTVQTATIWMVVLIAADRYIVVTKPLRSNSICTIKNAKIMALIVGVGSIIFNVPRWPHYYYVAFSNNSNTTSTFVSHLVFDTNGWNEELYQKIYHITLSFLFLFIVPFTVMVFFNATLIRNLYQARLFRRELSNKSRDCPSPKKHRNRNVNTMMIIIISTFLMFELPDFVASIIGAVGKKTWHLYPYYAGIKETLLVLNSSINFYLYCVFYKRFRKVLKKILGCGTQKPSFNPAASGSGHGHIRVSKNVSWDKM